MRLRVFALMMAVLLAVVAPGCSGDKQEKGSSGGLENSDGSDESGNMVITINGRAVYEGEIAQEIERLQTQLSGRLSPDQMQDMAGILRKQAIDNMINRILLEQAAGREGIVISDDMLKERTDQIRSGFGSDELFLEQLSASGLTEAGFKQEVELAMQIETLLDKQTDGGTQVSNAEIRDFYEANMPRFKRPERVKASHILIPLAETDGEAERAEKRQLIEGLLGKVKAGSDFAELAREHSSCPSKTRGGDLGFFGRGQMVKEFEDAAFALKVGEVSDVVETKFGFHIIKATDREQESTIPFEEAMPDIESYLAGQKKQQAVASYLDSLRTKATIMYPDSSSGE